MTAPTRWIQPSGCRDHGSHHDRVPGSPAVVRLVVLLALIPLGVAVLAYNGAVQAALGYAETVHVAFDLHRADLLIALRMELPTRQETEQILNEQWCDLWRQGIPLPATLELHAH